MKKVILMIAVIAAFTFASCTPKSAKSTTPAQDSISAVDSASVDTVAVDTVVAK
jgi:uncharacterized lipoprotein YbaY